jgi:hypothetical protein
VLVQKTIFIVSTPSYMSNIIAWIGFFGGVSCMNSGIKR